MKKKKILYEWDESGSVIQRRRRRLKRPYFMLILLGFTLTGFLIVSATIGGVWAYRSLSASLSGKDVSVVSKKIETIFTEPLIDKDCLDVGANLISSSSLLTKPLTEGWGRLKESCFSNNEPQGSSNT